MAWSTERKITVGFALALMLLLAIAALSYRSITRLAAVLHWEVHTHRVLSELHDVLTDLQDAETGQRGFIVTGEERYLEPYHRATESIEQEIAALRQLTIDNPAQQRRLSRLEPLIEDKLAELGKTIELRRREGFPAAASMVQAGQGKRMMNEIRDTIGQMQAQEDALLATRSAEADAGARQTVLIIAVGGAMAMALALIANMIIRRDLFARKQAERALQRAHEELERRVEERTSELGRSNQALETEVANRVRVEEQLQDTLLAMEENREHLLSVLDSLRLGSVIINKEGRVIFLSSDAQRLFGTSPPQALGQSWEQAITFAREDEKRLKEMLARTDERDKIEVRIKSPEGRHYWMEVEIQPDPRDAERRIFLFYDITEISSLRRQLDAKMQFDKLVGKSQPMVRVYEQIRALARVDSTVLIEGETGTGKELVARAIHNTSNRKAAPFVPVNCAAFSDSLVGNELFGHKRGAFTGAVESQRGLFEAADGGTLFLDEIGDISTHVQTALLRVLEEKEVTRLGDSVPRRVDVRVIAATHHQLAREVETGNFRGDLFYRLRVAQVILPPLRERAEDVPLLVGWFLTQVRTAMNKPVSEMGQEAMMLLLEHSWPGNVRELRNTIEYAMIRCRGSVLGIADLPPEILAAKIALRGPPRNERDQMLSALAEAGGNRTRAARLLGISRASLYRRLSVLGLDHHEQ